ncbi:hypothetical protein [Sporosarcina sp. FSL K6-1508]|uniref:hypothetical protein n=1 Tax=Sporosarcina sp. FSL K6-1508 TaxID=2921553 RepID=UPI0030FAD043
METEIKLCVIYALNPIDMDAELELMDLLQELGYNLNLMRTVRELNVWMRSANSKMPSLFITDLSNTQSDFKTISTFLSDITILCMHEDAVDEEIMDNGILINAFETYDEIISYLKTEDDEAAEAELFYQNRHVDSYFELPEQPFTDDNRFEQPLNENYEVSEGHSVARDDTRFDEPHPALKSITEFNHVTSTQDVLPVNTPPPPAEENHLKAENQSKETKALTDPIQQEPPALEIEENQYDKRSRNVQKGLFADQQREGHRMVGIWSPLHRMGVTSLSMNFALFLAQNRINIAVLEGITGQYAMKDWLKRYTPVPSNWISCARAIQTDSTPIHTRWKYCNIMFLPLDKNDPQYEWNSLSLDAYMSTSKVKDVDVTLVDMPTGKMADYTLDSLHHLDELWVVVDDSIQEILAWKTYIMQMKEQTKVSIHLVFNKYYSFSQNERISIELGIPLICSIPSLHEETMQNYYEKVPLYFHDSVQEKVDEAFIELASHLFKSKFILKKDDDVFKKYTWTSRLLAPFKSFVNR